MSTRASSSAVFPLPIENAWKELRDFTFPGKLIASTIASCTMMDNRPADCVGAVRSLKWKTGETRMDKLIELSDQFRKITWELIMSDPPTENVAQISTLKLFRISETNETLVEWSCDFSADISNDFVRFNQKAFLQNLQEMRATLCKK